MKLNRLLLLMQVITLVPLLLFLYIYTKGLYLVVILTLLFGYGLYRQIKGASFHYPLLALLIGSFLIYALYGLGSKEAPQKFEQFNTQKNSAIFTFEKPVTIDGFIYYIGIDKNSKFQLEYLKENDWKLFYQYNKDFPFSFRWNREDVNKTVTSKVRLKLTEGELMLGEVRFMQGDVALKMTTKYNLLNNEPDLTVDTTYFGGMFFDEIYHARTAYEIIHGLSIYETTHPYLGKILITPGIELFGMTPFGWRFMNVLFGALFIFVAYFFALKLFKKELFAWAGALMLTYSFMHFTQARIGLIDTFVVVLIFISYYFLYRFIVKQTLLLLLLSGLFFGLASAVKWSAVFASLGFVMIALYLICSKYPLKKQFEGYRLILYGLLSYLGLGLIVYTLTFFDIYIKMGSFQSIIDYHTNMFNYHSALKATHPYASEWWSWIIDFRPMCYYREIKETQFSSITVFGNPALFWVGTVSILYLIYVVICKRTLEAVFILFAFLGLYLPYMFVSRVMFIYHFYYALPFMILALLYLWRDLIEYSSKFIKPFFIFLIIVAGLFLLFYPVLSGYEVPKPYIDDYLIWFKGWWL